MTNKSAPARKLAPACRSLLTALVVVLCSCIPAISQEQVEAQNNQAALTAVPNRPSASTTAETVQAGVFEVEYGVEIASGHQDVNGLNKIGLTPNLEVRFGSNPFERDSAVGGFGDSSIGAKYRLLRASDGSKIPSVAFLYTFYAPTATHELGLEHSCHLAQILVSQDIGKHHFDFNEGVAFTARHAGFDRAYFTALAYSHPLRGKWGWTQEVSGWSRTNAETPANMSVLGAVTYNVSPRLVLDSGLSVAVFGSLPRAVFVGGVTYSVAEILRHR